jgi:glycosyltransferase involved in cell wall biosynthesis
MPFVSVIMPVRNEARFIERAVRAFLANDYPSDRIEVIVADGCSDDGTRDILGRLSNEDHRVRMIDNPDRIAPIAMNLGIQAARGSVILVVGAHSEFADDYLRSCVEVLERTGAGCVGGYMETLPGGDGVVARAISLATSSPFGVGGAKFRTGGVEEREVDTVAFGAFRREVYDKVGLYNPRLVRNQDMELSSRMRRAGYTIIASPKIRFRYYNRSTFSSLRRQCYANGLWNAYTLRLVGGGLRPRHLIPAAFVAGLVVLSILAAAWGKPFAWLALAYAGFYLLCGGAAAAKTAVREHNVVLLPLTWLAFVQMHVWYGAGTLWGFLTAPFKFRSSAALSAENAGR